MSKKPNVVLIYADDLGYGDLSCYGAEDIQTPNLDKLLECGTRFDSAYATAAVCTPARYSLLTGEYPFRNDDTRILAGDAKCIIDKDKMTLPKIFQQANYKTAVIGKWHLGLGDGVIDWNGDINHTPNDVGFDYSFIFPGTNDRVPCVYLRNRNIVNLDPNDPIEVTYQQDCPFDDIDTYYKNPEKLIMYSAHGHDNSIINGVGRLGYMRGGKSALWKDEDLTDGFLGEVKEFITEQKEQPFFLFYAVHQPHVPRIPSPRFVGATKLGPRGDVIAELDWCVGEVVAHLEEEGILEDTIIIFSSDNGPVLNDGYLDGAMEKNGEHRPTGPLRGGKYSKFDGGARIPFIVSWKNHMEARTSDAIVSQVDMMASFASMLGIHIEETAAPDSQNMMDLLIGKSNMGRAEVLFESHQKAKVLRCGKWEYLSPSEGRWMHPMTAIEIGNSLDPQLYNMTYDIGQQKNVASEYPAIVEAMAEKLEEILRGE